MSHHPYPSRDRALRQIDRGCVVEPAPRQPMTFADFCAYLESDEHRAAMRRIGDTMGQMLGRLNRVAAAGRPTSLG